jgi:hypothetical protein
MWSFRSVRLAIKREINMGTTSASSKGWGIACVLIFLGLGCRNGVILLQPDGPNARAWIDLKGSFDYQVALGTSPDTPPDVRDVQAPGMQLRYFQEAMSERPSNPTFRALCGILNTRVPAWSKLVLLEQVHPNREPSDLEQEYGFILIAQGERETIVMTNVTRPYREENLGSGPFGFTIRSYRGEEPMLGQCFKELEEARVHLPSVVLTRGICETPVWGLHYFTSDSYWFSATCVVSLEFEIRSGIAKGVPTSREVMEILTARKVPVGLGRAIEFKHSDEELYRKIALRYAMVMHKVWANAERYDLDGQSTLVGGSSR